MTWPRYAVSTLTKDTPSDDFIAQILSSGKYDVDESDGSIIFCRTGRKLKAPLNQDGYPTVTLFAYRGCQRSVPVHRMVAIKVFGIERVRGHQIGHRDGKRTNNHPTNLWIPQSAKEHIEHDGLMANMVKGQKWCKPSWQPCVKCGDPDGPPHYGKKTPGRINGARFGFQGSLCVRCYGTLHMVEDRRKRKIRASVTL